jgi:hypothetical protein
MMKKYPIILVLFLMCSSLRAQAQTADTTRLRLELKDGSILIGSVTGEDSLTLRFLTTSGIPVTVPHSQVRYKFPASSALPASADSVIKKTQTLDPNRTRLFLMPTARPIGGGQGYFSAYELFFPTLAFGISNAVSIAGGMSIFPYADEQLIYFAPKVTLWNNRNLSLALGSMYMGFGGKNDGSTLFYAAGTFGNERSSLTIASRIPTGSGQNNLFVIGGEVQLSGSTKFISENWIIEDELLYCFGFRFFGERVAADLGFFRSAGNEGDGFPFFPWLGFTYNFGALEQGPPIAETMHEFPPVTYRARLSYNFFTFSDDEGMRKSLQSQNFNTYNYSGGIFSSGDSRQTRGSGILLQAERLVRENLFAGITVSTIGSLIGSPAAFSTSRYQYQNSYYLNTELSIGTSLSTYGVHLAYSTINKDIDQNRQSFTLGAGFGRTDISMEWEYRGYGPVGASGVKSQQHAAYTGILFLLLEQRLSDFAAVGIDGSYFMMPNTTVNAFRLYDLSYNDISVNPPQIRTMTADIRQLDVNFSYGKIGLNLGVTF